jgi:hypothetical protein
VPRGRARTNAVRAMPRAADPFRFRASGLTARREAARLLL